MSDWLASFLDVGGLLRMLLILAIIIIESFLSRRFHMATKEELLAAVEGVVNSVSAEIGRVSAEIQALKDATDDGVGPADLDAPITSLNQAKDALDAIKFDDQTPPVE